MDFKINSGLGCLLCIGLIFGCAEPEDPDIEPAVQEEPDLVRVMYNNPDITTDLGVGLWAWPLPMDYDDDGDYDMVVSCPDAPFNGIYFFENTTGDVDMPVFEKPVKIHEEGDKNIDVSFIDGQPRILIPGKEVLGFKQGELKMVDLFPKEEIHKELKKDRPRFDQWKYVDYENDGDYDIIVGVDDWGDYGWDNAFDDEGHWTNGPLHGYVYLLENKNGEFTNTGRIQAGGKDIDVYGAPAPNFADFDGDGDLDIICGEFLDRMTWFENTGSREKPVYAEGRFLENANGVIRMDLEMIVPVAIDWNKDGFTDLIVGEEDGRVSFLKNTGAVENNMPVFADPEFFQQKPGYLKFGALVTPFSVDWDGDGDEDIIAGNTAGYIGFIENLSGGISPKWAKPEYLKADDEVIRIMAGENGSIQGPCEAKWGYTTLSVADWNGDGLLDVLVNSIWGEILWYENIGTKTAPRLTIAKPIQVDWKGGQTPKPDWFWWDPEPGTLATQWRTTPYAIDWNEDGLMDLVMMDHEGYLCLFERKEINGDLILEPGSRIFYDDKYSAYNQKNEVMDSTAGVLQFNRRLHGGSGRRKFAITDWNGDGRKDLIVNSFLNVDLMLNTGQNDGSIIISNQGKMAERDLVGHTTSPTVVDWDNNGIPDLLIGAEDGLFYYMENKDYKKPQ